MTAELRHLLWAATEAEEWQYLVYFNLIVVRYCPPHRRV